MEKKTRSLQSLKKESNRVQTERLFNCIECGKLHCSCCTSILYFVCRDCGYGICEGCMREKGILKNVKYWEQCPYCESKSFEHTERNIWNEMESLGQNTVDRIIDEVIEYFAVKTKKGNISYKRTVDEKLIVEWIDLDLNQDNLIDQLEQETQCPRFTENRSWKKTCRLLAQKLCRHIEFLRKFHQLRKSNPLNSSLDQSAWLNSSLDQSAWNVKEIQFN